MNDGYMDAAAFPVPDAGDDTLRDELARTISASLHGGRWIDMTPRKIADALLPLIREHVAAAVQTERERVRKLADVSGWHVYESQDTGDVYPAALVQDRMADIRAALDGSETP